MVPFWYDTMQPAQYLVDTHAERASAALADVGAAQRRTQELIQDLRLLEPCAEPDNIQLLRSLHAQVHQQVLVVRGASGDGAA